MIFDVKYHSKWKNIFQIVQKHFYKNHISIIIGLKK